MLETLSQNAEFISFSYAATLTLLSMLVIVWNSKEALNFLIGVIVLASAFFYAELSEPYIVSMENFD
eukprot:CAMPEP_0202965138 /NCGR_PEP_ID=MMETSP1396-20130829/9221_1 /ASSEMBLY_ACC=CAM_ASM_000872 /TAXON_ID= /ORGANISM="Pseudokeronopsis sp., Strain Brazil" /LENGTH=66 /DNA_ID=CAMNT_0049687767 /DNA_START=157 /DNA_END=357 /DNA_ORIENTATION=+